MDPTEETRRELARAINDNAGERIALEAEHGEVWDIDELTRDFEVIRFAAPLVVVRRKRDRKLGSLFFQHRPRFYFDFREDE